MAFKLKDRVKETTSTTGDGAAISLAGAESGFLAFSSAFSNNVFEIISSVALAIIYSLTFVLRLPLSLL